MTNLIRVALVYPNTYHVGMSSLGFQTVYNLLNSIENVVCEPAFLSENIRTEQITTIESGWDVSDVDIIAFSVSFENDYPNILKIIKKANLPFLSRERGENYPLVIAGGVACFLNPEPIAPFIDCFLLGEAEAILYQFFGIYNPTVNRKECLKQIAQGVPGAYIPRFYTPIYNKESRFHALEPSDDLPSEIRRVFVKDLSSIPPTCSAIVTADTAFDRTFLIEVSRGCPHGCRFCSAGYVYRPPRFREIPLLKECMAKGMAITERIGLVGAAVSDLPGLAELCHSVDQKNIRISFSSLRADALSPEIVSVLKQSRVKTATIAPDAGSQRMRDVINKGLTEEVLLNAVQSLVSNGIPNLKLYFMIGLPTETWEDVEEIVALCKLIKKEFLDASREKRHIGTITVSLNPFIPKPVTPFQWAGMDTIQSLKQKIKHIKIGLKRVANLRVHADIPRHAYIQALLSRGDRRVSDILMQAHANNGNWATTLKTSPVNPDDYILRKRDMDEPLPWDFIDHGIDKNFLKREYNRAKQSKTSLPCKMESCHICGVCKES